MISYFYVMIALSFVLLTYGALVSRPLNYSKALQTDTEYKRPFYFDVSIILLPVCFAIVCYKTFLTDYMSIPSGSMLPTLQIGTTVKVNKYAFGLRNPLDNSAFTVGRQPARGEIVVTQFPLNKQVNYVKRIVALPGDILSVQSDSLTINGITYPFIYKDKVDIADGEGKVSHNVYSIKLDDRTWDVIVDLEKPFLEIKNYRVPEATYFLLGDNLTASSDSRKFGGVPHTMLIGNAN